MSYIFVGFRVPELKAAPTTLQGEVHAPVIPFGLCGARKGLKLQSCRSLAVLFLPGRSVWSLEPWLTRTSCLVLYPSLRGIDIDQGEARSGPSGEADPAPPGSGETEFVPQPSGETEPALKASGEAEFIPRPSGETEPAL